MDGIKRRPPSRRPVAPALKSQPTGEPVIDKKADEPVLPLELDEPTLGEQSKSRSRPRRRKILILGVVVGLCVLAGAATLVYRQQLSPVNPNDTMVQRVEVKDGSTFSYVAGRLKERGLIRSVFVFELYATLHGKRGELKASTCSLNPSESSVEIIEKLTKGCHDFKSITFYPGATIEKPLYKPASATLEQTMYVKHVLQSAGYSDTDINAALTKSYTAALFAGKPANTTLEGYVFGETYYVDPSATAEDVLQQAFNQMDTVVTRNNLVAKFKAQGLTLYQGITLASIVQRELNCEDKPTQARKDRCYGFQQTIAQIFLKRLREGTSLGSDVTFIYAADMKGVAPSVDLDSPYNTRRYPGLPPGPIAAPGELALKAVANPASTDYLFFIAGDDGLLYFGRTAAEHQANIEQHCKILCSEL